MGITDTYGDGICCSYGEGFYRYTVGATVKEGGEFASEEISTFTVAGGAPVPSPTLPPVSPPTLPPVSPPTLQPISPPPCNQFPLQPCNQFPLQLSHLFPLQPSHQ